MTEQAWFLWGVLPLVIFVARIADVSIGTMRILFVVRGNRMLAAVLGFCEVFLWIVVIGQIMSQPTGLLHYVAYAAGFATGNYVGIFIESRIALGLQTLRVITAQPTGELERELIDNGYGATRLTGTGLRGGQMTILFSTVPRKRTADVLQRIDRHLPKAFVSIEDVRSIQSGHLPLGSETVDKMRLFPFGRKGK